MQQATVHGVLAARRRALAELGRAITLAGAADVRLLERTALRMQREIASLERLVARRAS